MKLIDFLVQELPKRGGWPFGNGHITCNKHNGKVFAHGKLLFITDKAITSSGDAICKEQYEAALVASKKPEWDGVGLPPVSCECEFFNEDYECRESVPKNGTIVKVVAHQKSKSGIDCAVFTWHGDRCAIHAEVCNEYLFRPIRSEAERKRKEAIDFLMGYMHHAGRTEVEFVYDAIADGKIPGVKIDDL